MNLVNPFLGGTPPPPGGFLLEDFNGPALNSDWDGSGGSYTFGSGLIHLTTGFIASVRNNLDFSFKKIAIISDIVTPTADWFLLVGDFMANTYIIEIRFQPSAGKIRLTQHTVAGGDVHHDYVYSSLADVFGVRLDSSSGNFELATSTDGITYTVRQTVAIDASFISTACQVGLTSIGLPSPVLIDNFDSDIAV